MQILQEIFAEICFSAVSKEPNYCIFRLLQLLYQGLVYVLIKCCCCNISGTRFVGVILVIAGNSEYVILIYWSLFGSIKICKSLQIFTDCCRKMFHHFDMNETSLQFKTFSLFVWHRCGFLLSFWVGHFFRICTYLQSYAKILQICTDSQRSKTLNLLYQARNNFKKLPLLKIPSVELYLTLSGSVIIVNSRNCTKRYIHGKIENDSKLGVLSTLRKNSVVWNFPDNFLYIIKDWKSLENTSKIDPICGTCFGFNQNMLYEKMSVFYP